MKSRLNGIKKNAKRKKGSELNAMKCESLGWLLLQLFVDEIQKYRSRGGGSLLGAKAIELRKAIAESGQMAEESLPDFSTKNECV